MSTLNPELDEHIFDLALNTLSTIFTFLLFLGFVTFFLAAYRVLRAIHLYYLHTSALPRYLHSRPHHAYALVTGASDGIGLAFAHALAKQDFNVVLHGRNAAKLDDIVQQMQQQYPQTSFCILIADASKSEGMNETIEGMATELANLPGPLTVLVNNVGGTAEYPPNPFTPLAEHSVDDIDALLNLNIRFASQLTRALIPVLSRDKNTPSLILNSGSVAGHVALPYLSVYAGSRAYIRIWTEALAREMQLEHGNKIEVMLASIGKTSGAGGHDLKAETWIAPSAEKVAEGTLHLVGSGWVCLAPTMGTAVVEAINGMLPWFVVSSILARVARQQRADRVVDGKKDE